MKTSAIVLVALLGLSSARLVKFPEHQVLRVVPASDEQLTRVYNLIEDMPELDFWRLPGTVGEWVDIRVTPEQHDDVIAYLHSHHMKTTVLIEDLQTLIEEQLAANAAPAPKTEGQCTEKYHTFAELEKWIKDAADDNSEIAETFSIGKSVEGRDLWCIKISGNAVEGVSKPKWVMDAGIHAREWISPATVRWIVNTMLDGYGSDDTITKIVDTYELTACITINPDGYSYTHTNNRMWRKTRRQNPGSSCMGVDANRNAPANFGGPGSSTNPCSEIYHGGSAWSAVEIKHLADYVAGLDNVWMYLNMHSYSQLILQPYGYTRTLPTDNALHNKASAAAIPAIASVSGTRYRAGPTSHILYAASGGIADYHYDQGIKHSYVFELRDTGRYGFILPPAQICDNSEETWEGIKAIIKVHEESQLE